MSIQHSSALLVAFLSRTTARATALRSRSSTLLPQKASRYLATDGPSGNDSSRLLSPADDPAAKKDASPSKKLTFADPDPSLPIVEYDTLLGRVRRNVKVSAKTNADTLVTAISPLLSAHMAKLNSTKSIGSKGWGLELDGAAITRFFAFDNEADATKFVDIVRSAADEMDHHPAITTGAEKEGTTPLKYVAISCSTHRPPGLSMRDVRLATKIDELAEPFNYMASDTHKTSRSVLIEIRRNLARELRSQRGAK
jgi:pterin-4a-carbinolamine dehydratase